MRARCVSGPSNTGRHKQDRALSGRDADQEKQRQIATSSTPRQGFDPTPKAGVAGSNPAGGTTALSR
jgi:hypothetical protein